MNDREIFIKVGAKIKECRLRQKLSTTELADKSGVKERFIQSLEAGKIDPSLPALIGIIENLSTSLSEFFEDFQGDK